MLSRLLVLLLLAAAAPLWAQSVVISEFLAINNGGLRDEDGDSSDWIELLNTGTTNVNLNGWCLTDSAANLTKWRFPSTNIPPGGFLIVFASGKNRAVAGAPLHANFSLSSGGEYLALVQSNGVTIASQFSPQFPEQFANVSYGAEQLVQTTRLVSNASPALVYFPSNAALGLTWTGTNFSTANWLAATNSVGYENYVPGFAVRNIRANVGVCDMGTAEGVAVTPSQQAAVFTATAQFIDYFNSGGGGNFGNDLTFPGFTINVDEDNFVTEATGIITIPTAGAWTFGVNSDDGFRCTIGANIFEYPTPRGPSDTLATFTLAAGEYPVRLLFYECGGGSGLEFFAAAGSWGGFNASFRLVGDTANGGLAVKSLPQSGGTTSLRSLIATDVQTQMLNRASSAYVRIPFALTNPAVFTTLTLRMKYDDGFVAYLNGQEIARRNSPASPAWNSVAVANRPTTNATVFEDIDATSFLGLLKAGTNVLALHGMNDATNSTDFLVLAELVENKFLSLTNHYFATPSPGAANTAGFFAFVENLKFTPGRGWFDNTNFTVTITSATPGVTIRYTTNGEAPTATNGMVYTAPGIAVAGTKFIRAVGYRDGFEPTEVETHSYIFLGQVQAQSTNSGWIGGSSGDYSLDTNITLSATYGPTFKSDLTNIPTLSIVTTWEDMFGDSGVWSHTDVYGVAWERPCSLEYMRPDGNKGFNVNCGIRIQGGVSRSAIPKHGMRVLFKNIYGPGKLDYPLYEGSSVREFDTLTLHGSFNDHWSWGGGAAVLHRDQMCRDTQNAMGGYGPHGTYVHLYINGLYWGLYNIGEKGDASYAASYLGGDKTEYDAFNSDELVDGNTDAWYAMFAIADAGITNDVAYTNLAGYLNIPNLIDYMLMNFYAANTDWPGHNWNAARRRVPGAGFHFFSWDAEWTFGIGNDVNTDRTGVGSGDGSPSRLYAALRAHPEFRMQFADHAQKHLFNSGALTPSVAQARWQKRSTEIDRAIVGETARWGGGNTRQTWLNAEGAVLSWFPQRTAILINQLRNAALFPALNAPVFTPFGGLVAPGYSLVLSNPNPSGAVYFTTDGSDPRLWGGAVALSAQLHAAPLTVTNALFVRARVRDGTNWSALVEAPFYVVQDSTALKVTEIMYHPPDFGPINSDDVEFLEIKNTGTNTLDLSGLRFTDGIDFAFTNSTRLAPGAFFVLVHNTNAFALKYPGTNFHGVYSNKLDNAGEKLTLAHVLGTNVFSFTYQNTVPWPVTPDGHGFSLVPANTNGDPGLAASWRPSANLGGSPGANDPAASIAPVMINEILTHTVPPQSDAIELFNPTTTNVNVSGWFMSDDPAQPKKYRLPGGSIIAPGGFLVVGETNFNPVPGVFPNFALNSFGESLYLFSGDAATNLTGYSHSFDYGAAAPGVSFGRYLISTGEEDWPSLASTTFSATNTAPRVGPVVINEVMYHPAAGYDEFVELFNLSSTNVPLYDPAFPTNGWKVGGLGYVFSNNVVVPAGGYLLLANIDPAVFRVKYGVTNTVQILGPYPGTLQDSGERLQLLRPETPTTNGTPHVVVDEVRYNDKAPWPTGADGDGPSIQRRAPALYGNEPTNWFASGITLGATNVFNQPPLCVLVSPTNGAGYSVPVDLALAATASDSNGVVVRVEFYANDVLIGTVTNAPFNFTWSNAPAGSFAIVAKARDNGLAVTASAAANITISPPPIGLGTGLRGDYYDNVDFTGTRLRRVDPVVNFDWGGGAPDPSMGVDSFSVRWLGQVQPRFNETYTFYTVTDDGVRLWVNNQLLVDRWIDQGPTEWSGFIQLQAGYLYDIKMEMYENGGGAYAQLWWSAPSVPKEIIPSPQLYPPVVSNLPPAVTITSPATGAVFVVNSPVNITVNATDPDGAVAKVEFFAGTNKIGTNTVSPFGFSWTNPPAGLPALRAVVTDDNGLSRTSAPVDITVVFGFTSNVTIVATGSVWRYHDKGVDLGSSWSASAFNDSSWSNGPAWFGYGDANGLVPRTTNSYGSDANNKYPTYYYRRGFNVTDPFALSSLNLRLQRDDGAVVYLNGSEVRRDNMAAGAVGYSTYANLGVGGADEATLFASTVAPGYLVYGSNVVAVEIHQSAGNSSDIAFDLELTGQQNFTAPYFTAHPQSRSVAPESNVTFTATVGGSAPLFHQWRFNGTNIAGATNLAFIRSNAQPAHAGAYVLVTTNSLGAATSQVATLTVTNPDTDGDGLPDSWELAYGLNPNNPADASADNDGDGMSNLAEFRAGTNPTNAASVLRVQWLSFSPARVQFVAQSNVAYTVQYQSNLAATPWLNLSGVAAQSLIRTVQVNDPVPMTNATRFYRVVLP